MFQINFLFIIFLLKIIFILAVNLHVSFQKNFTKKNESPVDSHKYTGRGGIGNHFLLGFVARNGVCRCHV